MKGRLLLVRDGLEGAVPSLVQLLGGAGLEALTISRLEPSPPGLSVFARPLPTDNPIALSRVLASPER